MIRPISPFRVAAFLAVCATCLLGESIARAGYVVTFQQSGGNVVASGSGSIDTAALSFTQSLTDMNAYVFPPEPAAIVGPTGDSSNSDEYIGSITGPATFGNGGLTGETSGSGDFVGLTQEIIQFRGGVSIVDPLAILVPLGYTSESALSDTSTYAGQSLSSLGITPGTYTSLFYTSHPDGLIWGPNA